MQNSNHNLSIPICDTWGVKKDAGYWNLDLEFDLNEKSIKVHNHWYSSSLKNTIDAFSSLCKVSKIYFNSISQATGNYKKTRIKINPNEVYEEYLEKIYITIENYPVDISSITVEFDFFVYVRTEDLFPEVNRVWIRKIGQSNSLGSLTIYLNLEDLDPYASFNMEHTLFYPFSYPTGEDNTELCGLNQPLLEKALKNWEKKFDAEIEADGLPGIYKYGYLPQDQW